MKHVSILALQNATVSCIDSCQQIFIRINDFLKYQGKEPFYQVEVVGPTKEVMLNHGQYSLKADNTIDQVKNTDLIVIPIICGDNSQSFILNEPFSDWIISHYANGTEIASLCVGSFFLAPTGLLNGKRCAIHWAAKNEFGAMFPHIELVEDNIITDENGIYTCGGAYSYLNLLLYIIEKHLGRGMSILASKMFEIDIDRKSQNQFAIFVGQKNHGDTAVLEAQGFIESNYTKKLTVEEVCSNLSMSRRTFERKFKKLTGNSVAEYIQRVKVEFVKQQLEAGRKTVNEIIYAVNYNDINAFRLIFKKHTGLTPIEYRKKYHAVTS